MTYMKYKPSFTPEDNNRWLEQAARLEEPEQVPVWFLNCDDFNSTLIGLSEYEVYADPEKMLLAQKFARDRFWGFFAAPGGMVFRPYFSVPTLPAGFGCSLIWPQDATPWVIPMIKQPEDIEKLEIPNPHFAPLWGQVRAYIKYFEANRCPPTVSGSIGPVDCAALLRELTSFFRDFYLNPDAVHHLLEKTVEATILFHKSIQEVMAEVKLFFIGDDTPGLIKPKHFEEFALPYNKKIFDAFRDLKCIKIWHSDTDETKNLEMIPEIGSDVFHVGPSDLVDIQIVKKKIGDKICIAGNINPLLLVRGSPKEVESVCKECIKKAAEGGGFILSPGGVLPKGSKPENIEAIFRAAEKYGRYPIKL
jgi:uroporphyrinogen decarboxylase